MSNKMTITNVEGEILTVELLLGFKIEGIGKEYIAYTFNDDGVSDKVNVFISEIKYNERIPQIIPIKEDEKEMVLSFYNSVRNNI